jgi:hypothetical protein
MLPDIIKVLEPEGFHISEELRGKLGEVGTRRVKHAQRLATERLAEEALLRNIAAGEEAAFVPASNSTLTRKLKKYGAYQVMSEEGYYGRQAAGLRVLERDLLETLLDVGGAIEPALRLLELLFYAWSVNTEAKETTYLSSRYRYMKKGYLLDELCRLAAKQQRFTWGWKKDPNPPANGAGWVLYFECDGVQCSFHTWKRGDGPDFPVEWDGQPHQTFPFASYLATAKPSLFKVKTGKRRKQNHRQHRRRRR